MGLMLVWLFGLLAAAVLLLWLISFPDARDALWRRFTGRWRHLENRASQWGNRSGEALKQSSRSARDSTGHWLRQLARHRLLLGGIVVLLSVPPILVFSLRGRVMLDGYSTQDQDEEGNAAMVTALLKGEQLVPPPPLPPEVFTTREVEIVRPFLATADRKWDKLDADFEQRWRFSR